MRTYHQYEAEQGEFAREDVLIGVSALLDESRELRMAAAERIEKLLQLIAEEAKAKIESLNKVTDKK